MTTWNDLLTFVSLDLKISFIFRISGISWLLKKDFYFCIISEYLKGNTFEWNNDYIIYLLSDSILGCISKMGNMPFGKI